MSFNVSTFGRFLQRKANEKLAQATGVNVMGEYHQVMYTASSMGVTAPTGTSSGDKVLNLGKDGKSESQGAAGAVPMAAGGPPQSPQLSEEYPRPLITTVDEFLAARDSTAVTPHGGALMLLHALLNFAQPGSRAAGEQMLVLCMWEDNLVPGAMYKNYALNTRDQQALAQCAAPNDAAVRSYVAGTMPMHGYWFDAQQVGVRFAPLPYELPPTAMEAQLLLWSSGAPAPRPVTLRKNKKGFWKVVDFAALVAPVQPPTVPVHTAADDL